MALRAFRDSRSSEEVIQLSIRLGLLAFLLYWLLVLVRPFIPILAWTLMRTAALYQAYNWLSVHLGNRPKLAAVIITVINLAIIFGPATWLWLGLIEGLFWRSMARSLLPAVSCISTADSTSSTGA